MKTSNKILLTLALLVFVSFTATNLSLYAKYKNGDYITQEQLDATETDTRKLDHFNVIVIENYEGISLLPSDSFAIRENHKNAGNFNYSIKGDHLILSPKNNITGEREYANVTLLCPGSINIILKNSDLGLNKGQWKTLTAGLSKESRLNVNTKVDSLSVQAEDESSVNFNEGSVIKKLSLQLNQKSGFTMDHGKIEQFGTIGLSDSSRIEADGRTVKRLM